VNKTKLLAGLLVWAIPAGALAQRGTDQLARAHAGCDHQYETQMRMVCDAPVRHLMRDRCAAEQERFRERCHADADRRYQNWMARQERYGFPH